MQFWQSFARTKMEYLPDLARAAEAAGYTGVTISDHLVRPLEINTPYPYSSDGKPVSTTETPFAEPWVLITHLAAVTQRLRFMPSVYVLPLRDPVSVAKSLGSTCVLSGNRVDLGIGVGWMREEFEVAGQDFATRGKRTDEMLAVIAKLMTGEVVEHHGDFYDLPPLTMTPVPGKMPMVLGGGESKAALRRAARLDGWLGVAYSYEELPAVLGQVADARREAGTLDRPFEIVMGFKGALSPGLVAELEERGVTRLVTAPLAGATLPEMLERLAIDAEALGLN